jgi:hypothetical protein
MSARRMECYKIRKSMCLKHIEALYELLEDAVSDIVLKHIDESVAQPSP